MKSSPKCDHGSEKSKQHTLIFRWNIWKSSSSHIACCSSKRTNENPVHFAGQEPFLTGQEQTLGDWNLCTWHRGYGRMWESSPMRLEMIDRENWTVYQWLSALASFACIPLDNSCDPHKGKQNGRDGKQSRQLRHLDSPCLKLEGPVDFQVSWTNKSPCSLTRFELGFPGVATQSPGRQHAHSHPWLTVSEVHLPLLGPPCLTQWESQL